jgi:hypothetical protein
MRPKRAHAPQDEVRDDFSEQNNTHLILRSVRPLGARVSKDGPKRARGVNGTDQIARVASEV